MSVILEFFQSEQNKGPCANCGHFSFQHLLGGCVYREKAPWTWRFYPPCGCTNYVSDHQDLTSSAMNAYQAAGVTPSHGAATTPNTPNTTSRPKAGSMEDAWTSKVILVASRTVTTRYGAKHLLLDEDGNEYWASPYVGRQIDTPGPNVFPARVERYPTAKGSLGYGYKLVPLEGGNGA